MGLTAQPLPPSAENRKHPHCKGDETAFERLRRKVQSLASSGRALEARYRLQSQGYDFGYAPAGVARLIGLQAEQILKPGKQPVRIYARSLLCYWFIRELSMTAMAVSKLLGISQSAVIRAAYRGEAIVAANSLELVERQKA
jgi:hypothetical protein